MYIKDGDKLFESGLGLPTEAVNLIPFFEDRFGKDKFAEKLKKIAAECISNFNNDLVSRKQWEDSAAHSLKLFINHRDPKTFPWKDCSNINLPFLTIACLQFQARAYDALINPKGTVGVVHTGSEDFEKAERVRRYMNYQLLYEMSEFEESMEKTLLLLPIVGCAFRKTYYDSTKKRIISTFVPASDLVVQYNYKVAIEEVERKSHILYLTKNDCMIRKQSGVFLFEKLGNPTTYTISETRREMDNIQGFSRTVDENYVFIEQHTLVDFDEDEIAEPYIITINYSTGEIVRITDRRYISMDGNMRVMEYFTKYDFIPNPEGFYGLGLGILLLSINEAANTIVNEVIDAGTLANLQGGFVSKRSGIKRGSLTFRMGEYKEVDTYAEDLSKSIMHLDFKGPNQTLYAVLGLLYEYSKLVSSVSEIMTGQLPASDTPASSVMAVLEEGRMVFSSIHKRIHRALKKELYKIFTFNSIYLDDLHYFRVLGNEGRSDTMVVAREDFGNTVDVFPVSDPTIISRAENLMRAEKCYQVGMTNPIIANNPERIKLLTKDLLLAYNYPNVERLLAEQPPPDMPPTEENAQFMIDKPVEVLPQQDHMHHIQIHNNFMNSTFAEQLGKDGKLILEHHIKQHFSFLYLAYEQMGGQNVQQR